LSSERVAAERVQPIRDDASRAPDNEIAARECDETGEAALPCHARVERDGRRDRRKHHRGHHHDPDGNEPAERAEVGGGARPHLAHRAHSRPPRERGDGDKERDQTDPRPRRREHLQLRRAHAAQANSEREKADFPS
jgi:hypothetical protein